MRTITSLLLLGWLCACTGQRFTRGRGEVGTFIIDRAVLYGGTPSSTNDLPVISETWCYREDADGVMIRLPRDKYAAVERFLQQAFGPPKFGPVATTDGARLGGYRLTAHGGGIQFTYDDDSTQVIVARPQRQKEPG